ncbi:hypothetical protein PIB30_052805 [Stylosanthes scabra]|uniref:DUF1639 family protein n=1 Tax=Stylosanthes scabra TaxID=79078 RepID=A0ABU6WGE8_9FABA|nr:hypothetical protein [Stylosanthes scabra]
MAMGPERSKALHNFSMPCLKWGHQRFLRCVKVPSPDPDPDHDHDHDHHHLHHRRSSLPNSPFLASNKRKATPTGDIDNIDAVRQKLIVDLKDAADKLKVSIFEEGTVANTTPNNHHSARPWNLRTRRAACKSPPPTTTTAHREDQQYRNLDSVPEDMVVGVAKDTTKKTMDEKPKFCVSLSKAEIEQDFLALVGTRPPRRPKKRPRNLQRQLDTLFPGLWLSEVSAESYKVPEVPE